MSGGMVIVGCNVLSCFIRDSSDMNAYLVIWVQGTCASMCFSFHCS